MRYTLLGYLVGAIITAPIWIFAFTVFTGGMLFGAFGLFLLWIGSFVD